MTVQRRNYKGILTGIDALFSTVRRVLPGGLKMRLENSGMSVSRPDFVSLSGPVKGVLCGRLEPADP
jgi:hypothetical protein